MQKQFPQFANSEVQWSQAGVSDIVDLDISITPLYVAEGQQVTMKIVNGKLDIQVSKQQ